MEPIGKTTILCSFRKRKIFANKGHRISKTSNCSISTQSWKIMEQAIGSLGINTFQPIQESEKIFVIYIFFQKSTGEYTLLR